MRRQKGALRTVRVSPLAALPAEFTAGAKGIAGLEGLGEQGRPNFSQESPTLLWTRRSAIAGRKPRRRWPPLLVRTHSYLKSEKAAARRAAPAASLLLLPPFRCQAKAPASLRVSLSNSKQQRQADDSSSKSSNSNCTEPRATATPSHGLLLSLLQLTPPKRLTCREEKGGRDVLRE